MTIKTIREWIHRVISALLLFAILHAWNNARGRDIGPGWPYRRPLYVNFARSSAPGKAMAWAEFYTNKARLPDGADLRVTSADGRLLPMRILRISPTDSQVRLTFDAPAAGRYWVWWGNPSPGAAGPAMQISRGVLMQIYSRGRGAARTRREMRHLFKNQKPIGSYFISSIFQRYNPMGPVNNDLIRYSGELHIVQPGRYVFAFDVDGAGYFDLDGNNLLEKRSLGWMQGRVRFKKSIRLKAGWHRVVVGQFHRWGATGVALDWRYPGVKYFSPVPPAAFAPIATARAGALRKTAGGYAADFSIRPQAQIFVPASHYFQRYSFSALVPASFSPSVTWRFSDGQRADGLQVNHVFMTPGIYRVAMRVNQAGHSFHTSMRFAVKSEMYALFPFPPADPPVLVANILNTYHTGGLNAEQLYRGVEFFHRYNTYHGLSRWGLAWARSKDPQSAQQVTKAAGLIARGLVAKNNFVQAANIYWLAAKKRISALAQCHALQQYAVLMCNHTDFAAKVLAKLQAWRSGHHQLPTAQKRLISVALAYAAVGTGNGKLASSYIAASGGSAMAYSAAEIRQGVLARNVESYIQSNHLRTARHLLDEWDADFPQAVVKGYTRLLRMKLLRHAGHPMATVRMAMQFVAAEPKSFYAARLLYEARTAANTAGHRNRALLIFAKLKQNYPESPYAYKQ